MPLHSRQQRGITLMGFVIVLVVAGCFIFFGMRVYPMYSEFYTLKRMMDDFAKEPNAHTMGLAAARSKLDVRLSLNYIESIRVSDIKFPRNEGAKMEVQYERRDPLVGNLDLVGKFQHTVPLGPQ
jgi:hypothetical protein